MAREITLEEVNSRFDEADRLIKARSRKSMFPIIPNFTDLYSKFPIELVNDYATQYFKSVANNL